MMLSRLGKVSAAVFTTLVAPVLVSIVAQELNTLRGSPAASSPANRSREVDAGPRDIVVSHGFGATTALARQEALRAALLQVAAACNEGATEPEKLQAACESILREPQAVILRCEDLACRKQVSAEREWYCQEISVEIERAALVQRLWAAH